MNEPLQILMANCAILLVEDNEDDAFLMSRAFQKAHLLNPVVHVKDGEEAISYLRGEGRYANRDQFPLPFLLLLDLNMPRVNGFEVLQWIREHSDLKRMLVVILTASTRELDIKHAYDLGAHSYLNKPGSFEELTQLLNRLHGSWLMTNGSPNVPPPRELESVQ